MKDENIRLESVLGKRTEYKVVLSSLAQILALSNNEPQRNFVQEILDLINQKDIDLFVKLINGIDMWGGSGAVWEVYIDDKVLAAKFEKQIITLIDLMDQTGILGKGIKRIKSIFQSNLKSNQ